MGKEKDSQRKLKGLETKKAIFTSAIKLFSKKSYDTVSIDDIVTKANTSKGNFYTHYKSKDQIIIELFMQIDEYYISITEELNKQKTAVDKLLFLVEKQLDYVERTFGKDIIRVVYSSKLMSNETSSVFIDPNRPLYKILLNIFQEGQMSGEFRNDLTKEYLVVIISRCMRGVLYDWCINVFDDMEEGNKFFSCFVTKGLMK